MGRINQYTMTFFPNKLDELLSFYENVYKKRYTLLKEGKTPNQEFLGKIAYPGHNPYGKFDYSKFPPNQIKEIKLSVKEYSWSNKFIKERVIASKEW